MVGRRGHLGQVIIIAMCVVALSVCTRQSDGDMMTLVEELYTILTKHFDNFGEVEVIEYLECRGEHGDIAEERERLEKELLLEYGGVPF